MHRNWEKSTILIVEDVESSIMYYRSAFKNTGARILLATDGEKAVEMAKANPDIDVIVMDIHMPKMNGLEATTKIKEFNPNVQIIIQTAYVLHHTEEECLNAGCDVFLAKPVSLTNIMSIIDNIIAKK